MSFIRILVFAALAFVVYNLLRRASLAMRPGDPAPPDERLNRLEPCARCGVYVDSHEALTRKVHGEIRRYCSDTCLLAAEAEATKDAAAVHPDRESEAETASHAEPRTGADPDAADPDHR